MTVIGLLVVLVEVLRKPNGTCMAGEEVTRCAMWIASPHPAAVASVAACAKNIALR